MSGTAPSVNYLPLAANDNGPDFRLHPFTVTDGGGNVVAGTIAITVTPVNLLTDRRAATSTADVPSSAAQR